MRKLKLGLTILPLVFLTGCWSIGPNRLAEDRFSYTATIGNSWKDEMLLNLVKIRYADVPVFLGVQSVISQYTLSGAISLNGGGNFPEGIARTIWNASIGGNAQYADRPTVTYAPMTGAKFGQSMMTPIPPASVVALLQSGYPAQLILRLALNSINGLQNQFGLQAKPPPPDENFFRLLDVADELQGSGIIGLEVKTVNKETSVLLRINGTQDPGLRQATDEFRTLLDLDPQVSEFSIEYGVRRKKKDELVMLTRSIYDVLSDLSGYIEVPPEHLKEAFASKPANSVAGRPIKPLLRIHSGSSAPSHAFVSVPYNDRWFWVDAQDLYSKATFSFLMFMFTLVEKPDGTPSPSIVLPAG